MKARRDQTSLQVSLFSPPPPSLREGTLTEAARLEAFLSTSVILDWNEIPTGVE
jgi:hypothetical protein